MLFVKLVHTFIATLPIGTTLFTKVNRGAHNKFCHFLGGRFFFHSTPLSCLCHNRSEQSILSNHKGNSPLIRINCSLYRLPRCVRNRLCTIHILSFQHLIPQRYALQEIFGDVIIKAKRVAYVAFVIAVVQIKRKL